MPVVQWGSELQEMRKSKVHPFVGWSVRWITKVVPFCMVENVYTSVSEFSQFVLDMRVGQMYPAGTWTFLFGRVDLPIVTAFM
jgi:hypothetical protein